MDTLSLFESPAEVFAEQPAKSSPPWVWFGYIFAFTFLVCEVLEEVLELNDSLNLVMLFISLVGWIYWLFCIHRFHKILGELSRHRYPITPSEAVGRHFIPFYNLVWVFKWSGQMSDYLNTRGRVKMVSGNVIGLLLLLGILFRFFDTAIALAWLFSVALYLSTKLRRHLEALKPVLLPPPPDPSMWASKTAEP